MNGGRWRSGERTACARALWTCAYMVDEAEMQSFRATCNDRFQACGICQMARSSAFRTVAFDLIACQGEVSLSDDRAIREYDVFRLCELYL